VLAQCLPAFTKFLTDRSTLVVRRDDGAAYNASGTVRSMPWHNNIGCVAHAGVHTIMAHASERGYFVPPIPEWIRWVVV
jgi:hypothetical protein